MHNNSIANVMADIAAGLAVVGSFAGYLPDVAAAMAITYYLFQFVRWLSGKPTDTEPPL